MSKASDYQRAYRAKKRAAGICIDCKLPATQGDRCDAHAQRLVERNRATAVRRDRVPTFDDFCRLEDER